MPKRKPNATRTKSGRAIPDRDAFDRGTPELQRMRTAILGSAANLLPLSHANPIDVLTAMGYLETEQNQAARDFQRVHRIVYGTSSAAAIELDMKRGGGLSVRARLVAERQLWAWTEAVARGGQHALNAFSRYVIDEYCDAAILAIGRGRERLTLDQVASIDRVRTALAAICATGRVRVSDADVRSAEVVEAAEARAA